jgi:hypothetical protein
MIDFSSLPDPIFGWDMLVFSYFGGFIITGMVLLPLMALCYLFDKHEPSHAQATKQSFRPDLKDRLVGVPVEMLPEHLKKKKIFMKVYSAKTSKE